MTVRIEAGNIVKVRGGRYKRLIDIKDNGNDLVFREVYADTREELEIIDHENFETEDHDLNAGIDGLKHTEFKHDKIMRIS